MLNASEGDFIWVSYGHNMTEEHHILIDGGVRDCGSKYAQIIESISEKNQTIDALILTHIDYDHIAGACDGIARVAPAILQKVIKKIIFNVSDRHQKEILTEMISEGYGVKDGIEFYSLLEQKGIRNKLKNETVAGEKIELAGGAVLKIISPGERQLRDLYDKWEKYEKKSVTVAYASMQKNMDKDLSVLMNDELGTDNSVNNGSSIAFLLEFEGYKGAFLADAKPSVCISGMSLFGIKAAYPVDFVKISHHGSRNNTSLKLLQILQTENYLLSTDGNHGKVPSKTVIAKLIRNSENMNLNKVSLYCNYKWWENVYYNKYFTRADMDTYINTRRLQLHILKKEEIELRDGLKLYGRWQNII